MTAEKRAEPTPEVVQWFVFDRSDAGVLRILTRSGTHVGDLFFTRGSANERHQRDRARLIAAAPDTAAERDRLKAVLESIANSFWTDGETDAERLEDLQGLARLVLAKESTP